MKFVKAADQYTATLNGVSSGLASIYGKVLFPEAEGEDLYARFEELQFQALKENNPELHGRMILDLQHMTHSICDVNLDYDPNAIPGLDLEQLKDLKEFSRLASKVSNIGSYQR